MNNAGIHLDAPSHELDTATYERVMQTNATAVFTACREAYPHLVEAGGGTIVNIGSFFDKIGVKRNLAYCASKAAVGAMTRCLAVEWASKGIRVLDVAPGYIDTDLNREALESGPVREYIDKRIPGRRPARRKKSRGWSRRYSRKTFRFSPARRFTSTAGRGLRIEDVNRKSCRFLRSPFT